MATRRIMPSIRNAHDRAHTPAGRSSSRMPSGVSAATTVSSIWRRPARASGFDDDRVGNVVVHAASLAAEDEERVDDAVERDHSEHGVREVTRDDHARDRHFRTVFAQELDLTGLLADRLAVLAEQLDGEEHPRDETDAAHDQA